MSISLSSLRLESEESGEHADDTESMSSAGQKRSPPGELEREGSPFQGEEAKRQKPSQLPTNIIFRLLCPAARTGSIIGKGGEIIRELREQTGTKIKVEDPVPHCEDRVVTIIGPDRAEHDPEHNPAQDAVVRVFNRIVDSANSGLEPAQVFMGRMLLLPPQVGSILGKGGKTVSEIRRDAGCSIRILQPGDMPPSALHTDQYAQLVQVTGNLQCVQKGLAGICNQLRINPGKAWKEPGSGPLGRMPLAAAHTGFNPQAAPFRPSPGPTRQAGGNRRPPHQGRPHHAPHHAPYQVPQQPPYQSPLHGGPGPVQHMSGEPEIEIGYRLLIPVMHVGAIIGRHGEAIAQLRQRTGARVKVHDAHDASEQRVVSISGREEPSSQTSPAIDALLYCAAPVLQEEGEPQKCVRLVVPSSQVGCVLGKQGSIVSQVRQSTGAMVRVLEQNKGQRRLESGEEVDEVIEIQGRAQSCDLALQAVSDLLRQYQVVPRSPAYGASTYSPSRHYSGAVPAGMPYADPNYPSYPPPDTAPSQHPTQPPPPNYPNPSYSYPPGSVSPGHGAMGYQQPPAVYQQGYEAVDQQYDAAYDMTQPHYSGGYEPGAVPQGSIPYEAVLVPPVSPYRSSPYEAVPPPLPGTYSQGTPGVGPPMAEPAGNSRVQLTIVGAQVGAVLGRNGTNISQIRQISGAKVRLHEAPREAPRTAASQANVERQLDISGASSQVQAAMKLVQAFLLAGNVELLNIPNV